MTATIGNHPLSQPFQIFIDKPAILFKDFESIILAESYSYASVNVGRLLATFRNKPRTGLEPMRLKWTAIHHEKRYERTEHSATNDTGSHPRLG